MNRVLNWTGQALLYGSFAVALGVFSRWPVYHPLPPDMAQIKVSFIHHGVRIADCRPFTAEEQVGSSTDEPDGCRPTKPCGRVLFDLLAQRAQLLCGIFLAGVDAGSGIFGEFACAACHGLTRGVRNEVADILTQERNILANAGKQIGGAGILMR